LGSQSLVAANADVLVIELRSSVATANFCKCMTGLLYAELSADG
jgi:hypothetical protein